MYIVAFLYIKNISLKINKIIYINFVFLNFLFPSLPRKTIVVLFFGCLLYYSFKKYLQNVKLPEPDPKPETEPETQWSHYPQNIYQKHLNSN